MGDRSRKQMEKQIREIQRRGTFNRDSGRSGSSLDADLRREIQETETMLEYLGTYKGQHAVLLDFIRKMKTVRGWVPTPNDRRVFFSIIKNAKGGAHMVQEKDPLLFAMNLDIDTRPSSLEQ